MFHLSIASVAPDCKPPVDLLAAISTAIRAWHRFPFPNFQLVVLYLTLYFDAHFVRTCSLFPGRA